MRDVKNVGLVLLAFLECAVSPAVQDHGERLELSGQASQRQQALYKNHILLEICDRHDLSGQILVRLEGRGPALLAIDCVACMSGLVGGRVDRDVGPGHRGEMVSLVLQSPCHLDLVQSHCRDTTSQCQG